MSDARERAMLAAEQHRYDRQEFVSEVERQASLAWFAALAEAYGASDPVGLANRTMAEFESAERTAENVRRIVEFIQEQTRAS